MIRTTITVLAVMLVIAGSAGAKERKVTLSDLTVMTNGTGVGRILVKTGRMAIGSHEVVRRASLRIPFSGTAEDRAFEVRVFPITRDWSPARVDWEDGWTRPGGDFQNELYARGQMDLSRGGGEITFDITSTIREIVEYDFDSYGFLITERHADRPGLRVQDAARFQSLQEAELTIETRTLVSVNKRGRGRRW